MAIRLLNPTLINQIAAGEVIERPASALKELVENAIDAGATELHIQIRDGGRTYMSVTDNGSGMSKQDLEMCVERHATSKIPDEDLFNIMTLGFRGEALPSIGAVSRLNIITKAQNEETAWKLSVEGGIKNPIEPASFPAGTRIEIRDLFFATPARLKFLKASATELSHITDMLHRIALAHQDVSISLKDGDKEVFRYTRGQERLNHILGRDFLENTLKINGEKEGARLEGYIGVPTYNRSSTTHQYLFVNGRPVKDKVLSTALKVGYQDFLGHGRHPVALLFLEVPPAEVDVNVHPAKSEVRFRDAHLIRGFMISAIKNALTEGAGRSSTTLAEEAFLKMQPSPSRPVAPSFAPLSNPIRASTYTPSSFNLREPHRTSTPIAQMNLPEVPRVPTQAPAPGLWEQSSSPLGQAKAQIHQTYIIAEADDKLIIVDQHAAHERLVYEKLKEDLKTSGIKRQVLLIPEVLDFTSEELAHLKDHLEDLQTFGFRMELFGGTALLIREVPALLSKVNLKELMKDIVGEIMEHGQGLSLHELIHEKLATWGCHSAIRSGRTLSLDEMNALLRQMEAEPHSGQCNHGRPTYISLDVKDIEKLFGRR